jgi:hypothetical protein
MTQDRRRQVRSLAAIAFVVLGHAALIAALALAGEWRVWRFIMNATAQLYALAGMGWLGWQACVVLPRQPSRLRTPLRQRGA